MSGETFFVFGVLGLTIVLFASDRVRLDIVAILVVLALMLSGVLTAREALAGFGDSVVMMVAALFVVGEALVRTGVAYAFGDWLMKVGGASETRLILLLVPLVGIVGAPMSSTGIVAIFIPVVMSVAAKTGIRPSRLMMPLAFAAMISGMITLISTPPNMVVSGALRDAGYDPFSFFSFSPIGLLVLAVGTVYMVLIGRHLLPGDREGEKTRPEGRTLEDLVEAYGLTDRLHRARIGVGSPLVGQTVANAKLRTHFGVTVIGVERQQRFGSEVEPALATTEFRARDVLYLIGLEEPVHHFLDSQGLDRLVIEERQRKDVVQELGLAEVVLAPESKLIGRTLLDAAFRSRHGVSVLAIRRKGHPLFANFTGETLQFGDSLLVAGGWKHIARLQVDKKDFLVLSLPVEMADVAPVRRRAPWALAILAAMIVLMTLGLVPNVAAVLLAALAMVLTGCVSMDSAYKVINWQSLILIAGMLPMATALEKTGGTQLIVDGLVGTFGDAGPYAMMAGLFVLTAALGSFISNTATAVLLAPIAIGAAEHLGVSPYPLAMTVAIAASAAFMTPVSSPVNTLVVVPGNYGFNDFVKVGTPMVLLVMAVTLLTVPLLFPL
jgi:di/tricarboxylate transporter